MTSTPAGPGPTGSGPQGTNRADDPAAIPPPPVGLWNLANALTVLRLMLVPVVVWLLLHGGSHWRVAAFALFMIASVTDLADGEIARRRHLITDFGKIADPIADKALTGGALICLCLIGELAWWVTVVIVAREVAVTVLRFWVINRGVIAASRGGKLKTTLQIVGIGLYILPLGWPWTDVRAAVLYLAVLVTLVTGFDYLVRAYRLHDQAVTAR